MHESWVKIYSHSRTKTHPTSSSNPINRVLYCGYFHLFFDRKHYAGAKIWLVENATEVFWAHISMVEADMACLELLLNHDQSWVYYLNLAGSELPR